MIAASTREEMQELVNNREIKVKTADPLEMTRINNAIKKGKKIPNNWPPWFRTGTGKDVHEMLVNSLGLFDEFRHAIKGRIAYFNMREGTIVKSFIAR